MAPWPNRVPRARWAVPTRGEFRGALDHLVLVRVDQILWIEMRCVSQQV